MEKSKFWDGCFLFCAITLFAFSIYLYGSGYHNMDFGQNLRFINAQTKPLGFSYVDLASDGNTTYTGTQEYIQGIQQIQTSFLLLGLSSIFIGVFIARLVWT